MGFWKKFKKAVKKAVKTVKKAVHDVVNKAADAINSGLEYIGNGISDGLNKIGEKLGIKKVTSWIGGIIKGALSLVGALIKGFLNIVSGIVTGLIQIIGGIISLQWDLILDGFLDIVSNIFGTIILVLGKLVVLIQTILWLQNFERPLTEKEKQQMKRVFKDTINYYLIRIVEGNSGVFRLSSRPFTLGNTIYMKYNEITYDLLCHECTHVWQYENIGSRYASDAVGAQWFIPDEYSWEREITIRGKVNWLDFNKEAQAQFLQDIWIYGDDNGRQDGVFYDDINNPNSSFIYNSNNYTELAKNTIKIVRMGWWGPWP